MQTMYVFVSFIIIIIIILLHFFCQSKDYFLAFYFLTLNLVIYSNNNPVKLYLHSTGSPQKSSQGDL